MPSTTRCSFLVSRLAMIALAAYATSASLAACGGDDAPPDAPDGAPVVPDAAPPGPDAGPGIALGDISARLDEAYCDLDLRCHFAVSVDACLQGQVQDNPVPQLVSDVAAGRVEYHGDAAQACLDAIAASDCSLVTLTSMSEACQAVFIGKVAVGGTCSEDGECVSGLCNSTCGFDECCAGSCEAADFAPIGGACTTTADCDYDGYCPATGAGAATCVARLDEGAACAPGSDTCQLGLVCDGTCKRLPAHGEACVVGEFLSCNDVDDQCDPDSALCASLRRPGDACDVDHGLQCVSYARCVIDTCVALAVEGEDCAHNECYRGLKCGPDVKCVKVPADPICP